MKKVYDLVIEKGKYTNRDGVEKKQWQNVGVEMENEDGGRFILMDRTFSPAGVPNPDNRSTVLISKFKPKDKDAPDASDKPANDQQPSGPLSDDNIPF